MREYAVSQTEEERGKRSLALYNLYTLKLYDYFWNYFVIFSSNNEEKEKENDDEKRKDITHCSLRISLTHQGITIQTKPEANLTKLTKLSPAPETIF